MSMNVASTIDVVIAGAGPAGLAVARACAGQGLTVAVVSPNVKDIWPATYGFFVDDGSRAGLQEAVEKVWSRPFVQLESGRVALDRPYAFLNKTLLQDRWIEELLVQGVSMVDDTVVSVENRGASPRVNLVGGDSIRARVVVDATGARSVLMGRDPGPAAQVALGWKARVNGSPWGSDEACWMDLRPIEGDAPTFLYALETGPNEMLLEETSLAAASSMGRSALEARLARRLDSLGIEVEEVLEEEWVHIPLLGDLGQPQGCVVGFGAAAGFVHPSTGYSLTRSIIAASAFAASLARGLSSSSATSAVQQAHRAVWPASLKAARECHNLGARLLLMMDSHETHRFFSAFFHLPQSDQKVWLSGEAHVSSVARVMATLFGQSGWDVRRDILRASAGLVHPFSPLAISPGGSS